MRPDPQLPKDMDPRERVKSFAEVVSAFTEEEAVNEAKRCLQCKNAPCISGCPVGIDIKGFIKHIAESNYRDAFITINERNTFPGICGRVCPAEYQCRKACVLTKKGEPFASKNAINIHFLERFAGDYGTKHHIGAHLKRHPDKKSVRVAIVGSGPAGLSCAGVLAHAGVDVTIHEALHHPGGVLSYGIPPFRLPFETVDSEIAYLKNLGVEIKTNIAVGNTIALEELFDQGYRAVFLGLGAGTPVFPGVPGENLCNVISANEFLTRINLMRAYAFPNAHTPVNIGISMVVIGGGNTAIDSARVALRMQIMNGLEPNVIVLYRRTEKEMPARRLEIEHAREEGVKFQFLIQPVAFESADGGCLTNVKALRCELGEPDASGRRRPKPIPGSEFSIDARVAIVAIGLLANQLLLRSTPSIAKDKWGDIIVNPATMETSVPNVYAGGDIVGGEGTVIEALGMGKRAAETILARL